MKLVYIFVLLWSLLGFFGLVHTLIEKKLCYSSSFSFVAGMGYEKLALALSILSILFTFLVAWDRINIWMNSVPDGIYCLEVVVSSGDKSYTLPAEVKKMTEEEQTDVRQNWSGEYNSYLHFYDVYHVVRAFWPNGGYLYFGSSGDGYPLGIAGTYYDQDDQEWEILITDTPSIHPMVQVSHQPKKVGGLILWMIIVALAAFEGAIGIKDATEYYRNQKME